MAKKWQTYVMNELDMDTYDGYVGVFDYKW